ncbi:ABC transporter ATP-binding protein [Saliphagus sp. GCM10025334]
MTVLETAGLEAGYDGLKILHGVDFVVNDGEFLAIIGANGAGKSTLIKAIMGLADRMGGSISYMGKDITDLKPHEVMRQGIGYVPQGQNIFPSLTVRENLKIGAYTLDELPEDRLQAVFDRFPILEERLDQRAGSLSGGQRQMVAIGRSLITDPDLLILDEPSAGLAPDIVADVFDRLDAINDDGKTLVVIEQNVKVLLEHSDLGYVLAQGEVRMRDDSASLLANDIVQDEYFGH